MFFRIFSVLLHTNNDFNQYRMSFFSRLFGKKDSDEQRTGGMEDFMTLVRVYFQASIAENVGISNLAMLPDLRVFKATLKVPTLNNKLGEEAMQGDVAGNVSNG